ncbi:MAG: TetR/AcrR family transcriptional regulator [Sphingomonadales bacterium]|nr:TetR/AcrR family transcriptional regulator [Sphingomonadales bacterium]
MTNEITAKKAGRPRAAAQPELRAVLLRTARELLDADGPAALSMREVARRAGCTHQAPYHHFEDRESILAELVRDGFDDLAARLAAANECAEAGGLRAALVASARAYVAFALAQPGVFRIMFRPDACNPARFPEVREAGARARAELQRLATLAASPVLPADQVETILWAQVHGLAGLALDSGLMPEPGRAAHLAAVTERFAELILHGRWV